MVKNLPASAEDARLFQPLGWEDSQRKAWKPTPVFSPGESHGQRSLVGSFVSIGSQRVGLNGSDLACTHVTASNKNILTFYPDLCLANFISFDSDQISPP